MMMRVLLTRLACGGIVVEIRSRGSSQFTLDHPTDMVWRKSTFVCGRTIGILSDQGGPDPARDLMKNLVAEKRWS